MALREASFSLGAGTIAGLVGVNGSGKSTLFKSIMGFVRPSAGRVEISGMSVQQALIDSWETRSWQRVKDLADGADPATPTAPGKDS